MMKGDRRECINELDFRMITVKKQLTEVNCLDHIIFPETVDSIRWDLFIDVNIVRIETGAKRKQ